MEDLNKDWLRLLEIIKAQLSPANFKTWFAPTKLIERTPTKIVIAVPSAFIKQQLTSKYSGLLDVTAEAVFGGGLQIDIKVDSNLVTRKETSEGDENFELQPTTTIRSDNAGLNPK